MAPRELGEAAGVNVGLFSPLANADAAEVEGATEGVCARSVGGDKVRPKGDYSLYEAAQRERRKRKRGRRKAAGRIARIVPLGHQRRRGAGGRQRPKWRRQDGEEATGLKARPRPPQIRKNWGPTKRGRTKRLGEFPSEPGASVMKARLARPKSRSKPPGRETQIIPKVPRHQHAQLEDLAPHLGNPGNLALHLEL